MKNLWDNLPIEAVRNIYDFDPTKKENFDNVIAQLRNTCILCKTEYSKYVIKDNATNYLEETEGNLINCTHSFCVDCYTGLANRHIDDCPICNSDISIITEAYYIEDDLSDSDYSYSTDVESSDVSLIDEFSETYNSEEDYESSSDSDNY